MKKREICPGCSKKRVLRKGPGLCHHCNQKRLRELPARRNLERWRDWRCKGCGCDATVRRHRVGGYCQQCATTVWTKHKAEKDRLEREMTNLKNELLQQLPRRLEDTGDGWIHGAPEMDLVGMNGDFP